MQTTRQHGFSCRANWCFSLLIIQYKKNCVLTFSLPNNRLHFISNYDNQYTNYGWAFISNINVKKKNIFNVWTIPFLFLEPPLVSQEYGISDLCELLKCWHKSMTILDTSHLH